MAEMIKVGLLGIVGVLIAVQFKAQKPEYGIYIGLAIGILIFCYVLKEFDMILKLKESSKKVKNDLTLRLDFSFKDISTLLRKLDSIEDTQATSGNKTLTVKFMAEYVFSSKLNFRFFCDHQTNRPYISTSYPMSNTNVGVSIKFMLTR